MLDFIRLRKNRVHKFKPKVEILSDRGPFVLKTVSHPDELMEALRLRYEVFHREMIGKTREHGIDVDEFDFLCDHLVIIEKKTKKVVGTYRLNCSRFSSHFYSAQEFNLRRVLEKPGVKTELGRACIHKDYRRGLIISLLWRGIAEYMMATQSDVLFGCTSIKTESPRQAALLYHHFARQGLFHSDNWCPPSMKFSMPGLALWIKNLDRPFTKDEESEIEELIPPLAKAYFKAGATFAGEPAYDAEFKCIDFLGILTMDKLNQAMWKKFSSTNTEGPTAGSAESGAM